MVATATLETRDIQGETLAGVTDRLINTALIYEGVIMRNNPNSFEVKQNLGTDMNVKIGSTVAFDQAVIQGDSAGQGVFITEHQNATQVLAIAASDPTLDRIDIVILRIYDDTFDSSGDDFADLEVVTGTPDASPVPPAVPAGSFVLAEILVQNAVTQIVNGDITDKRVEAPIRGELVKTVYFVAGGTFTKADHPWLHKVRVRLVAGGGGGGGAAATIAAQVAGGGGGGGGGYAEVETLASALGTTETVTVGAGGAAGVGGAAGGVGGVTSFGSLAAANGGFGGGFVGAGAPFRTCASGAGDSGTAGDLFIVGGGGTGCMLGDDASVDGNAGGSGGDSGLGGGAKTLKSNTSGGVGGNYGGGAGGAANAASQSARNGGVGAAGIVIVDQHA